MQISEKGVWYFEPLKTVISDFDRAIAHGSKRERKFATAEIKDLRRIVGGYTIWHVDHNDNLMPDSMSDEDKATVFACAESSLVENVPHARLAEGIMSWHAFNAVLLGDIVIDTPQVVNITDAYAHNLRIE